MKKRIISLILSTFMMVSAVFDMSVVSDAADVKGDSTSSVLYLPTGDMVIEAEYTSKPKEISVTRPAKLRKASTYGNQWDKYSCYAIYNMLPANEKRFWDNLNDVCVEAISTTATYNDGYLPYASASGMTAQRVLEVLELFYYCNPQYYFLKSFLYSSDYGTFAIYSDFKNGSARSSATSSFKSKADSILALASVIPSDEKKVLYFQQAICSTVEYDYDAANGRRSGEALDQSAYSALCLRKAVCAGYSKAMAYLCNASDIDCFDATSTYYDSAGNKTGHEWNMVRLSDNWYNIDTTWADQSQGVWYKYYLKSDADYSNDTGEYAKSHRKDTLWSGIIPACNLSSSASDGLLPGTVSYATETTVTPQISVMGTTVAMASQSGARIFYTIDGSTPSESSTKAELYRSPITVSSASNIKAIAVYDGYLDSSIATAAETGQQSGDTTTVVTQPDDQKTGSDTNNDNNQDGDNKDQGDNNDPEQTPVVSGEDDQTPDPAVTDTTDEDLDEDDEEDEDPYEQAIYYIEKSKSKISSVKAGKKNFTVKFSKTSVSGVKVKYRIRYKVSGGKWKYVSTSATSKKITKLKSGKKYLVQVQTMSTIDGDKYYGKWSSNKSVKVK